MSKCFGKWLFTLLVLLPGVSRSQCSVKVFSNPTENYCGNPFFPYAIGDANKYVITYANDFNAKTLGSGWTTTANVTFDNPCGSGNGTPYLWMGNGTSTNRNIATVDFDVSRGGKVCFDLRFAEINGTDMASPGCEAPDKAWEGVYFQYSTDGGLTWQDIFYFNPEPFPRADYTKWANYCYSIPSNASTVKTRFRWLQMDASGSEVDHWGLDNIQIFTNDPNFEYLWDHTSSKSSNPGAHIPPTTPFTYRVTYMDKSTGARCKDSIKVTTIMPKVVVSPGNVSTCAGNPVQLDADYQFSIPTLTCGTNVKGCQGTPQTGKVGNGMVTGNLVFNNSGAGSNKTQFIIRASEIGFKAGQLGSIAFNAVPNPLTNMTYLNFYVKIGCTTTNEMTGNAFISGLTTVFSTQSFTFKPGWSTIDFTNYYNWNGTSNLVVEICWTNITNKNDLPIKGDDLSWNSTRIISGGVNSTTNCSQPSGGNLYKFRPQVTFGYCTPVVPVTLKYTWLPDNGLNPSNSIRNPVAAPGATTTYTVTVVDTNNPHCLATGSVEIKIKGSSTGSAGRDSTVLLCQQAGSVNLFALLGAGAISGGTWKDPSGNNHSGTINPATAASGVYTYRIVDPDCGNVSAKITVNFQKPPNPGVPTDSTVCKTGSPITLNGLLKGNPVSGGTWTDDNASGGLVGGTFRPDLVSPGIYNMTYTVPGSGVCPAQSATAKITVLPTQNAGSNSTATVCSSGSVINLLNLLSGSPQNNGTWTNNNGSGTLSGHNLNMTGMTTGTYTYTYNIPANNYCKSSTAILTLKVVNQPTAGSNGNKTLCNTTSSIDLKTVLGGTPDPGGTWTDINGAGQMSPEGILNVSLTLPGIYKFNYTLSSPGCPVSQATATVTINKQNYSGIGRDTLICAVGSLNLFNLLTGSSTGGTWTDVNATGRLSGSTFNMNGISPGIYTFNYSTVSAAPCVNQSAKIVVFTEKPANAGTGTSTSICLGDTIRLSKLLTGNPGANGVWSSSPVLSGLNSTNGFINAASSVPGTYQVNYVVSGKAPCLNDTANFTVKVIGKPKLINPQYFCTNQNRQYYVEMEISGGVPGSYTVNPSGTIIPGNPYRFRSSFITSKTGKTFYITDINNCSPDSISVYYDCGCVTQAGNMQADTIRVCENVTAKAQFDNGFVTDGNDTLIFVLHEGSMDLLINPKLYNALPEFSYNPLLTYGKVYFISAVASNKGSFHGLDQTDSCFTVSKGTPVIFNAIPNLTYNVKTPICQGDSFFVDLHFIKGNPPFQLSYIYKGVPGIKTFTDSVGLLALKATSTTNLILSNLSSKNCTSPIGKTLTIAVDDSIAVSTPSFQCNNNNNAFTINFNISHGNLNKYAVSGISGTLSGNVFTSSLLPSPSSYNFSVTDSSVCPPISISGNYTCPCITDAGNFISSSLIKVCGSDTARPVFGNNSRLDGNDRQYFILHDGNNFVGNILDTSTSPEFYYRPGMTYGKRYYISSVAGDSTQNFIDSLKPCFHLSNSVPVEFYPVVSGTISGSSTICESAGLQLTPILNGFGPFNLKFTDQENTVYNFSNVTQGQPLQFNLNPGSFRIIFTSITDVTSGCTGIAAGSYTVSVMASPRGSIVGDTTLCENSGSVTLSLELNGQKSYSVTISENGTFFNQYNGIDSGFTFTINPNAGKYVYKITQLKDSSPSQCPGIFSDSAVVQINPLPNISISGTSSHCVGEGSYLKLNTGNIYAGYSSKYRIQFVRQPGNDTTTYLMQDNVDSVWVFPVAGSNSYQIISVSDQNTGCFGSGSGTANLLGIAPPVTTLSGNNTFCDAPPNNTPLFFTHTGTGVITTYYTDNEDNHYQISGAGQANPYVANHQVNTGLTTFFIDSVIDGSTNRCAGTFSGTATIKVHKLPGGQLKLQNGSRNIQQCENESNWLVLSTTGQLPLTVSIKGPLDTVIKTLNGSIDSILVNPPVGNNYYLLTAISDGNTPVCQATGTDSVLIQVAPNPAISFLLQNQSVCEFNPVTVNINVVQGIPPFKLFYSVDGVPNPTPINITSSTSSFDLNLLKGNHEIRVDSLVDQTNLSCRANAAGIPPLNVYVRPTPALISFSASQNSICYDQSAIINLVSNVNDSIIVRLVSEDSSWYQILKGSDQFILNNLRADKTIHITDIEYGSTPKCPTTLTDSVYIKVNALPTAQIISPDFPICQNDKFPIHVLLTGAGTINGTIQSTEGKNFSFSGKTGLDSTVATASTSSTFFFPPNTIIDQNNCTNSGTDSLFVTIHPRPVIDFKASLDTGCAPLTTRLINLTNPIYLGGGCEWTIASGHYRFNNCDSTPEFTLNHSGSFDVNLKMTTAFGCTNDSTIKDYLNVFSLPRAAFQFDPNPVYISNTLVQFFDQSTVNTTKWHWDFGSYGSSEQRFPQILFPAEPDLEIPIKLTVWSDKTCSDSTFTIIKIKGELLVYVPNSFTPNNDNRNELFVPSLYGFDENAEYNFEIFDRWGTLIFSTTNPKEGWNGDYKSNPVENGVYAYRIKVESKYSTEIKVFSGHINLIR